MKKTVIFLLLVVCVLAFIHIYTENTHQEKTLYLMNTVININIKGNKADMEAITDILKKYDKMLDMYDENSEIYKINQGNKKMSNDIKEILLKGYDLCKLTNGAFDYTLKPVVDLWGISEGKTSIPKDADIKNTLLKTGYEKITLNENNIDLNGAKIDLGGIAKGYVTEKLIDEIKRRNIKKAVIDLGGNLYVLDSKKDVKVGIQKPFAPRGEALLTLDVNDTSVISSGTYERYFEDGGKIYHHIFDAKTGYPADNKISSVTIIGKPLKGDALSTALLVMDIEKATKLYEEQKDFEFIIVKDNKVYVTELIYPKVEILDSSYKMFKVVGINKRT